MCALSSVLVYVMCVCAYDTYSLFRCGVLWMFAVVIFVEEAGTRVPDQKCACVFAQVHCHTHC